MEEYGPYILFLAPLAIILVFGTILIKLMQHGGRYARRLHAQTQLVGAGIPTTAEVLEIRDTGLRRSRIYILVDLHLAVRKTRDFDDFEARTRVSITAVQVPAFSKGQEIRVKVDASDHRLVVVDQPRQ